MTKKKGCSIEKVEPKKEEKKEPVSKKQAEREKRILKNHKKMFAKAFTVLIILAVLMVASLYPLFKMTKFGLDLQGGFEILYKVNSIDGSKVNRDMVVNTYNIILKRIDILGVSEPEITIEDNNIRVQLAGVTNEEEAKTTLSKMANLTFRDIHDNVVMTADVLKPNGVKVIQDQSNVGNYSLSIEVADVTTFAKVSQELYDKGEPILMWLDFEEGVDSYAKTNNGLTCGTDSSSRCISYATFRDGGIASSSVSLTGNFTKEDAQNLADLINSGSLPTKLEEISSRTVNAAFGQDALEKTFLAGIVGVLAIILLLILIYRFSGVITSVAIITYTALVFLIFNLIEGRLTLPSIAAVVIGIGMAVDAAVISFSRIKEELRAKRSLEEAVKNGNKNSLSSIIDANITTLIAAVILFIFGESSVKGFATMLIISIFVSLVVMVYLFRVLLKMFAKSGIFDHHYQAFLGIRDLQKEGFLTKISFTKWNPRFLAISLIILVAGSIYVYFNGFNLGIDFKGGSSISLSSTTALKVESISKELEDLGYRVEKAEQISDKEVYLTVADVFEADDNAKVENYFKEQYQDATTSIGAVSNIVKKQLLENAIKSLIYALIGLIIYVSLRFTFSYGISSIFALFHDCLMVVILFSLLHLEVTSIFIAAILSIIGYSINNTIVAFDRVRENKQKLYHGKIKTVEELKNVVDVSLKEVINRSLLTSLTTLLPVISLIVLGSHEIINFNYALLFGLIAGTYSSLFLALQIWYLLEKRNVGKPEKKKWYEVEVKDDIEELKVKGINC